MIKDSGDRREFSSGAVRDMGGLKGRCDLLPLDAVYWLLADDPFTDWMHEFQRTYDVVRLVDAFACLAVEYSRRKEYKKDISDYLLAIAVHMANGAAKYGERNWEKGIPVASYVDSAVRHYLKHLRGDDDEPHLVAAGWNVLCCLATVLRGIDPTEDKPNESNTDRTHS